MNEKSKKPSSASRDRPRLQSAPISRREKKTAFLRESNKEDSKPLKEIVDQIKSAEPFTKENVRKLKFIYDEALSWGELFQCLDKNENEKTFFVIGRVENMRNFAISPSSVTLGRRSQRLNVDRYNMSIICADRDSELLEDAVKGMSPSVSETVFAKYQNLLLCENRLLFTNLAYPILELLSMFESQNIPKRVALRMKMRKPEEDFEENPIKATFSCLYHGAETYFSTTRLVARRGEKLPENLLPPFPAGIPDKDELSKAGAKYPPSYELLPLIPVFRSDGSNRFEMLDARKLSVPPHKTVKIVFRVKQDAWFFVNTHGDQVEKIHVDCSPIAVIVDEAPEINLSPASKLQKRRISSF